MLLYLRRVCLEGFNIYDSLLPMQLLLDECVLTGFNIYDSFMPMQLLLAFSDGKSSICLRNNIDLFFSALA